MKKKKESRTEYNGKWIQFKRISFWQSLLFKVKMVHRRGVSRTIANRIFLNPVVVFQDRGI